ncbi:MAG: amidohydrolase [Xanthomonadales bacterium]|nr:amidohydrolase [Xanthomonadales bacterium]MBK7144756.1 amidohydrolase [Xanthomonadales bacterium]MCC6561625.1 amidohydrolase [Xanthomonadales bacterium]
MTDTILPGTDLRVTLVQAATHWHDAKANRVMYGDLLRPLAGGTDLVVLPEAFTSGFTNETLANAETMDGVTVRWMGALASELNAVVSGSVVIRDGDRCVNRLVWMRPDETCAVYDKRHLFRMAGEHERYAAGSERLIVELNGWRVCPLVCYDLRFPVFLRNAMRADLGRMDYDLLLFVANWPAPRRGPWRTLLRARAIENLCYAVGVNRVGRDGNGLDYAGDSAAIDFLGEPLLEFDDQPQLHTITLSANALAEHRERFPAWRDADAFILEP